jgi:hypothetical protein
MLLLLALCDRVMDLCINVAPKQMLEKARIKTKKALMRDINPSTFLQPLRTAIIFLRSSCADNGNIALPPSGALDIC